jgi:hypothetical protein
LINFFIIIGLAKLARATYNMNDGDTFIVKLLLAILLKFGPKIK